MSTDRFDSTLAYAAIAEAIVGLDSEYDDERQVFLNIGGAMLSEPAPIRIEVEDAVETQPPLMFEVIIREVLS